MASRSSSLRTTTVGGILTLLAAFVSCAIVLGLLTAGVLMPAVGGIGGAARGGLAMFEQMPEELTEPALTGPTQILAANGELIAQLQDENRISVTLAQVAPVMRTAQVAIEDHRFYEHGGLDLQGTMRAFVATIRGGGAITQGGSSLTQQYVKQALQYDALSRGDTAGARAAASQNFLRKIKELKFAMAIEQKFSKDQILEKYLNIVYYGDGAYGVEAASLHYFSKHASQLTLSEAALLAGLVQNPSTTDPIHAPNRSLARRNVVLDRMHTLKLISDKDWAAAKARPLAKDLKVSYPKSSCNASPYPYFCDYVKVWLLAQPALGETPEDRDRMLKRGGLVIQTTFDPRIQKIVNEEIIKRVPIGNSADIGSAAFVTEPGTGKVLAFGQNTEYSLKAGPFKQSLNWAVETKYGGSMGFQFGSTEKAFALVTALEAGMPLSTEVDARAASSSTPAIYTASDFPDKCGIPQGEKWPVLNDTAWRGGAMSLMEATALSTNTAFVALVQELGACKVRDTAIRLGMHRANGKDIPASPAAIILGAAETAPQTVANAYAVFASEGKKCDSMPVVSITQRGKVLYTGKPNCTQVISPDIARGVTAFLSHNMTDGSGRRNQLIGRESAGKTGTSNGNNESWFVGYTPQLSVAVWVGTPYNDPGNSRTMFNVSVGGRFYPVMHGAAIAAPIWKGIMDRTLDGQPSIGFGRPSDQIRNGDLVDIPNVRGMYQDEATQVLQAAGFTVAIGSSVSSNYSAGRVERTVPRGQAVKGGVVTLLLSNGTRPATRPATTTTTTAPPTTTAKPTTKPTTKPTPTPTPRPTKTPKPTVKPGG